MLQPTLVITRAISRLSARSNYGCFALTRHWLPMFGAGRLGIAGHLSPLPIHSITSRTMSSITTAPSLRVVQTTGEHVARNATSPPRAKELIDDLCFIDHIRA